MFLEVHRFSIHLANVHKLYEKLVSIPKNISNTNQRTNEFSSVRNLRNHLEHFEERLEAWFYMHSTRPYVDCITFNNETKGINCNQCLRALNTDSEEYFILGEVFCIKNLEINLEEMHRLSIKIRKLANKQFHRTLKSAPVN